MGSRAAKLRRSMSKVADRVNGRSAFPGRLALTVALLMMLILPASAQIGEHRSDLAVGVNGGYAMSSVRFLPKIPQKQEGGLTAGLTVRYTCEKYFKSICAIVGEVNMIQMGWKENIMTSGEQPVRVLDPVTNQPIDGKFEAYSRQMTYVQIPIFARLGWGRERRGLQAFFQVGPQISYNLSESTKANFDLDHPNTAWGGRASQVVKQYHMPIENRFDYGIAGGLGVEFSNRHIGHIMLEGRYYYGLGNIYGNSKRDYFAASNFQTIVVKMSYLFDISRTKNDKIK